MIKVIVFFALLGISMGTISPTHADEKYLVGRPAKQKLADEYSVRLRSSEFSGRVWCYKEAPYEVAEGRHPLCGINDQRKIRMMSVSVFVGKSSVSDDEKLERALENILLSDNYKLQLLEKKEILPSIIVTHYRVSWSTSSYNPYVSVVQFPAAGNTIFAVFFPGGADNTGGDSKPIKEEVETYLNNRRLGPAK